MNILNLTLKKPESEDWEVLNQIAMIEQDAFQEDALSIFNLSLLAKINAVLILIDNRTVVAEAVLIKKDQSIGLIFGFAVCQNHRNNGIGSLFLSKLIEHAKGLGLTSLILTVNPENKNAMYLYKNKFGFKIQAKVSSHPVKNEQRWVLEKDITEGYK